MKTMVATEVSKELEIKEMEKSPPTSEEVEREMDQE